MNIELLFGLKPKKPTPTTAPVRRGGPQSVVKKQLLEFLGRRGVGVRVPLQEFYREFSLDSGYASRVAQALENDGLLKRKRVGRKWEVTLT